MSDDNLKNNLGGGAPVQTTCSSGGAPVREDCSNDTALAQQSDSGGAAPAQMSTALPTDPADAKQPAGGAAVSSPPRAYTPKEILLLPAALLIGLLFDRLIAGAGLTSARTSFDFFQFTGAFWLCYLAVFYALYWKALARDKILWLIGLAGAALCVWNFFPWANWEFRLLAFVVTPCVLMAHAQLMAGGYPLKAVWPMARAWLLGWLYRPFSGIPAIFGAVASLCRKSGRSTSRNVALGLAIALPVLCVVIPLLCAADRVFAYYAAEIIGNIDVQTFILHAAVVAVASVLFYSFLWNAGFGKKLQPPPGKPVTVDVTVAGVALGAVMLCYLLFVGVQFTYLFAGAGLPGGMTYSAYAREGFAQTVAVCVINLVLFGAALQYTQRHKIVVGLLAGLLVLTGVMLVSGSLRLGLYIGAYGMTWLRLISAWFIAYLAAVIALCAARLRATKLPVVAICALVLLCWYVVLGYANPDGLVHLYNQTYHPGAVVAPFSL